MTQSGIEPATFRFVAQNLNHCAIVAPFSKNTHTTFFEWIEALIVNLKVTSLSQLAL